MNVKDDDIKKLTMNMPMPLFDALKIEAKRLGLPVSGLINFAMNEYLKQNSIVSLVKLYEQEQVEKNK